MLDSGRKTKAAHKSVTAALLKKEEPEKIFHTVKFVGDVPLRLYAEVARTEIDLRHILAWKNGSIVKFDKIIGEPVEVLIGNQLIARGEVVVINNRFGIRISEITRPDEKIGTVHH
ncbi:MAG: flagellar motor switch protein FliN [SAR324 cluster bacterium]|nr:flagellar motor switch protein FliN [SAR324 cluster bacterium]